MRLIVQLLDLGFKTAMNAIVENLPVERQTLLYSATQTKSVQDLARLSLKDLSYISTCESSATVTPQRLTQSYIVCDLPEKLNILYSFIHNHTKYNIIVFFSSCKQVEFTYEAFCRLRPGVPLMALYGKQKQLRRVASTMTFISVILLSCYAQTQQPGGWISRLYIGSFRRTTQKIEVFDVHLLPTNEYAASLGLVQAPTIKYFKKVQHKTNRSDAAQESDVEST